MMRGQKHIKRTLMSWSNRM